MRRWGGADQHSRLELSNPAAIAVSASGNTAYLVDEDQCSVLVLHVATGALLRRVCGGYRGWHHKTVGDVSVRWVGVQWGSEGSGPGQLQAPAGIAISPVSGDVVVADTDNARVAVFSKQGQLRRHLLAGPQGGALWQPVGVAVTERDEVIVVDMAQASVQLFALADGRWLGRLSAPAPAAPALQTPIAVAVHPIDGTIWLLDQDANCVHVYD